MDRPYREGGLRQATQAAAVFPVTQLFKDWVKRNLKRKNIAVDTLRKRTKEGTTWRNLIET